MPARIRKKCKNCIVAKQVAGCLFNCDQVERVTRELDAMMRDLLPERDPIEEQLKQCPEAFKAGELIETMFNAAKFGQDGTVEHERLLPPAGAVIPPLV